MARRTSPASSPAAMVASSPAPIPASAMAASAAIYKPQRRSSPTTDRNQIAKPWQVEVYRHLNICGEARYAATLFAAMAARAEIGVSEPQALSRKAVWVKSGPEVDAFAELVPTVRERRKLITDYMTHMVTAGECYLIARDRVDTDPGYISPPEGMTWDDVTREAIADADLFDPDFDPDEMDSDPNVPLWEIVAVTELRKIGDDWEVRHENGNYLKLSSDDPVIRLWNPDPENRMEAWSPFRALLPTLREIEWLTKHIFTQVRSRLMSAGVWFLPENLTFPPPPADAVDGGAEAMAGLNEAELFMLSLAASSMKMMEDDDVSFPSIVMADPIALASIDQERLIKFWSEIDDKAMTLRDGAIRRFGLGMDLPSEMAVDTKSLGTGTSGSNSATNHWGEWAKQEQAISTHVEPALDIFVGSLTASYLRTAVEGTDKVLAYDTASLRLRQDRSKEALEWYDRGVMKAEVALRETGFDPETDMMDAKEFERWLLVKLAGGSATPEQVQAAMLLLGVPLPVQPSPELEPAPGQPGRNLPPSLEGHTPQGPPEGDHDHNDAPYSLIVASCEGLALRALEKAGNRLLNNGKRGRDKDRDTPAHMAHLVAGGQTAPEFDFTLLPTVFSDLPAARQAAIGVALNRYCTDLYDKGEAYSRQGLMEAVKGL